MQKTMLNILLCFMMLSGCAGKTRTIQPPVRDADLYPGFQKTAGFFVAVDEIANPDRMRRYFGVDLMKEEDILPVMIVFTNRGDDRFLVNPLDVLLLEGNTVTDPVPLEQIEKTIKGGADLIMQETSVPSRGSYRGVLFYRITQGASGLYGRLERLFASRFKMRIVATNQSTGERIHFEPFSLYVP